MGTIHCPLGPGYIRCDNPGIDAIREILLNTGQWSKLSPHLSRHVKQISMTGHVNSRKFCLDLQTPPTVVAITQVEQGMSRRKNTKYLFDFVAYPQDYNPLLRNSQRFISCNFPNIGFGPNVAPPPELVKF